MENTKLKEKVELLVDSSRINLGYESMQVKIYSEEEVLNILNEFCDNFYENSIRKDVIEKWFEQFKKK